MRLRQLILSALFAALTAAGSLLKIPVPGTTLIITLQTFFVFMAGLMLEPRYALFSQLVYAAMGLIGLPVFSGGGGFGYIYQPSFGFIIGFCVCSFVISALVRKNIVQYNYHPKKPNDFSGTPYSEENKRLSFVVKVVSGMLLSVFVLYVFGVAYMYIIYNLHLHETKSVYALIFGTTWIFMIVDIVKFSIALPLCIAISRRLPRSIR